jgi:outer membrane protein assembly factor BamB
MRWKRHCFQIIVIFFALHPFLCRATEWPHWRGPNRNGVIHEMGHAQKPTLNTIWDTSIGRGYSAFAIADGRAYTMGHDGQTNETLYCFDAETGEELWTHTYPGELIPRMHAGGPNAMPSIVGQRLYTVSKDGQLFCYKAADGTQLWRTSLVNDLGFKLPTFGFASAPLVVNGELVMHGGQTFALDPDTGSLLWKSEFDYIASYVTPVRFETGDSDVIATLYGNRVVVLDPKGVELASQPFYAKHDTTATTPVLLDAADGTFFVSANEGGRAVQYVNGGLKTLWEASDMKNEMNASVLVDGHLYGFSGRHDSRTAALTCIRADDGKLLWSETGMGCGSLIANGKRLLVLSESGEVVVAEASPDAFRPVARKQILEKRCWTPPSLSDGKLYIRNEQGRLACVSLRE